MGPQSCISSCETYKNKFYILKIQFQANTKYFLNCIQSQLCNGTFGIYIGKLFQIRGLNKDYNYDYKPVNYLLQLSSLGGNE